MGLSDMPKEIAERRMTVDGDPAIARNMRAWLTLSPFAGGERRVA
jgi:hypothetical protein